VRKLAAVGENDLHLLATPSAGEKPAESGHNLKRMHSEEVRNPEVTVLGAPAYARQTVATVGSPHGVPADG